MNVNAILADSNLKATIDNVSGITGNANRISYDAKRISDDLTRRYFAPTPWWKKLASGAEFGVKAGNKVLGWW